MTQPLQIKPHSETDWSVTYYEPNGMKESKPCHGKYHDEYFFKGHRVSEREFKQLENLELIIKWKMK